MTRFLVRVVVASAALAALLFAGGDASADRVYHSERLPLSSTGLEGHPELRSGHVVNIHPNGPENGALERYSLNGAAPNTAYAVVIVVDTSCGGDFLFELPTVTVQTNARGVGHGRLRFTPEDLADLSGATLGVHWEFRVDDDAAYDTECTTVTLD